MIKRYYITYKQHGKLKKAVLDENLFKNLFKDKTINEICEYDNEKLMEKKYAEKLGVSKQILLG